MNAQKNAMQIKRNKAGGSLKKYCTGLWRKLLISSFPSLRSTYRGEEHGEEVDSSLDMVAAVQCHTDRWDEEQVAECEEQSRTQLPRERQGV